MAPQIYNPQEAVLTLVVGTLVSKHYNNVPASPVFDAVRGALECYYTFEDLQRAEDLKRRVLAVVEHPSQDELLGSVAQIIPDSDQTLRDLALMLGAYFICSPLGPTDPSDRELLFEEFAGRYNNTLGVCNLIEIHTRK